MLIRSTMTLAFPFFAKSSTFYRISVLSLLSCISTAYSTHILWLKSISYHSLWWKSLFSPWWMLRVKRNLSSGSLRGMIIAVCKFRINRLSSAYDHHCWWTMRFLINCSNTTAFDKSTSYGSSRQSAKEFNLQNTVFKKPQNTIENASFFSKTITSSAICLQKISERLQDLTNA